MLDRKSSQVPNVSCECGNNFFPYQMPPIEPKQATGPVPVSHILGVVYWSILMALAHTARYNNRDDHSAVR